MFVCLVQHTLRAEFVLEAAPSMLLLPFIAVATVVAAAADHVKKRNR